MRRWFKIPVFLAAIAPLAVGQNVTLKPDIGVAQAEYHDALESWINNDRYLTQDLLTGNPEQMRQRVRKAGALRDQVMLKKEKYLDLIIQRLHEIRAHLAPANAGDIPVDAISKDLEVQQARLASDQERIEASLRELPTGDEYLIVRRALEAERTSRISLQSAVASRIRSIDILGKSQDALRASAQGEPESQTLDDMLKVWNEERATAIRQRTTWATLYKNMEQEIDNNVASQKKATPVNKSKPKKGK